VGHPWRKYFLPGLTVKLLGALFIGMIYQYYYHGGDTGVYFREAKILSSSFYESPKKWFNLMLSIPKGYEGEYIEYTSRMVWYNVGSNYMVVRATSLLGIFTFNTFLPTSLLFTALSFTGVWAMFRAFATLYKTKLRAIAICFLFIPSSFIWGSGIFKDTLCIFALGWMLYGVFKVLILRKISPALALLTLFCFYLLVKTKIYIPMAFIPALLIWVLFNYSSNIKIRFVRTLLNLGLIAFSAGLFFVVMN